MTGETFTIKSEDLIGETILHTPIITAKMSFGRYGT